MVLVCADGNVVLRTRRFFDSVDRIREEVLANVGLIVVGPSSFFAFGGFISGYVHDMSSRIFNFARLLDGISSASRLSDRSMSA